MDVERFLKIIDKWIIHNSKENDSDIYRLLKDKYPDVFNYFVSLYLESNPNTTIDYLYPTYIIPKEVLVELKDELSDLNNYTLSVAFFDFLKRRRANIWLKTCKDIEEFNFLYGKYENIGEAMKDTGYPFIMLYTEMCEVLYDYERRKEMEDKLEELKKNVGSIEDLIVPDRVKLTYSRKGWHTREENKLRLYLLTRNRIRQNNVKDTSEYLDDIKNLLGIFRIGFVEKDLEFLKGLKEQYPDNEEIDKYLRKFEKILEDINSD